MFRWGYVDTENVIHCLSQFKCYSYWLAARLQKAENKREPDVDRRIPSMCGSSENRSSG